MFRQMFAKMFTFYQEHMEDKHHDFFQIQELKIDVFWSEPEFGRIWLMSSKSSTYFIRSHLTDFFISKFNEHSINKSHNTKSSAIVS